MKVLDLKLQAFGPFLKEQHISFEHLNDKGMFLINGPTGTGKTSIFDAIVYALYGQGSGLDRNDGKSLRSDFAKDEDVTFVELTFEANNNTYKILRKGEYYRKKAKGEGLTLVSGAVELTMPDGTIISGNKAVEDKILNDILFINIKQFKNIALLAQGEFTELVTAKTPERAKILEHIFQKEIYDEFQARLKLKADQAEKEMNAVITSVNTLINQVEDGDQIIGYQEALSNPSNIPTFVTNLEEHIKILNDDKVQKEKLVNELKQSYEESRAKLDALKRDNEQIKKYLNALEELETLNGKQEEINNLKKRLEIQLEINELAQLIKQKDQIAKELIGYKEVAKQLSKDATRLEEESKWLKDNQEKYELSKKEISSLDIVIKTLESLNKQIDDILKEKAEISQKEGVFANNFAKFKIEQTNFNILRNRFFASLSYNLAEQLKDDEPCPVCGSTHHPQPAEFTDPVSESEFDRAEKHCKQEEERINALGKELTGLKSAFKAKVSAIINTLKENGYPDANEDFIYSGSLPSLCNVKKQERSALDRFVKDYDARQSKFKTDNAAYEQKLVNNNENISKNEINTQSVNSSLEEQFKNNQFVKTIEDYIELIRDKLDVNKTRTIIEQHSQKVTAAKTIIENTSKDLIAVGNVDESSLVEETNKRNEQYKIENEILTKLVNKITNLMKSVSSIKKKYSECEDIINRYSSLSELARTANGNNKMKLSFKMFILADYFDKIIVQANKRLNKITNGRYRLVRRSSIKGGGQQGLDLDVYDIETGKNREASSLSGGEKFVSALSMALGLSDIIETNHALIQVESIFIDEGFGSLDENYLDMAMKALETLKEDNKTIAIISHVEKLKDYLPDGIEVRKDTIGSKIVVKDSI